MANRLPPPITVEELAGFFIDFLFEPFDKIDKKKEGKKYIDVNSNPHYLRWMWEFFLRNLSREKRRTFFNEEYYPVMNFLLKNGQIKLKEFGPTGYPILAFYRQPTSSGNTA